jgi:hypothetical protein
MMGHLKKYPRCKERHYGRLLMSLKNAMRGTFGPVGVEQTTKVANTLEQRKGGGK